MNIIYDARVLTHKVYTGVENYASSILEGIVNSFDIRVLKPSVKNKYLSHLWLHFVLPFKRGKMIISPANIAPIYIPKSKSLVLTLHDLSFLVYPENFSKLFSLYYKCLIPYNIKRADCIITASESSRDEIVKYFPSSKDKVKVIYLSVDSIFKQLENFPKKHQVLYVGSLNKRKNFISVIKIFNKLRDSSIKLKILGNFSSNFNLDGETEKLIKTARENSNITFLENVSKQKLIEIYNESKLFIFPSFYEGFGYPVLEAMSCGTPVLCSAVTSLPEVGGEAVLYIDPNNLDDILTKTELILGDEDLQLDMVQKGLKQAEKFSLKDTIEQHKTIFQSVLNEK